MEEKKKRTKKTKKEAEHGSVIREARGTARVAIPNRYFLFLSRVFPFSLPFRLSFFTDYACKSTRLIYYSRLVRLFHAGSIVPLPSFRRRRRRLPFPSFVS